MKTYIGSGLNIHPTHVTPDAIQFWVLAEETDEKVELEGASLTRTQCAIVSLL